MNFGSVKESYKSNSAASRKIESTKATPSAHSTPKRCATPAKTPSKEKAETEFRRLRQSFCFKARPLPSFYNERETPKSPLKKVEPDFDLDIKDDVEEECSNFGKTSLQSNPSSPIFSSSIWCLLSNIGSYKTKEEDVARISTSIYVTNFSESFSAKDLFHSCKHMVMWWMLLFPPNGQKLQVMLRRMEGIGSGSYVPTKGVDTMENGKSFATVLSGNVRSDPIENEVSPAIVLDDDCHYSKDLSKSLLGRVKEVSSLSNLKKALVNEGFDDLIIHYMGRVVWVEIKGIPFKVWSGNTFNRIATKWGQLLDIDDQEELCFHSKRLCIYTKIRTNIFENLKIVYHGKMCWLRAKEVPGWVPDFLDDSDDEGESKEEVNEQDPLEHEDRSCGDDNEVNEVPETIFDESSGQKMKHSEDPFGIYPLLNKKNSDLPDIGTAGEGSRKYPPGFTPKNDIRVSNLSEEKDTNANVADSKQGKDAEIPEEHNDIRNVNGPISQDSVSVCSGKFKKLMAPKTGGLAQKAKKDWVKELCVKNKVNFLALQETKMESIDLISVKSCWGNLCFDHVHSDSMGNSGGILCVWDPNSFRRNNVTILDYFVIIRGVWLKINVNLLIVVVYAPHDSGDKRLLWDYLIHVSNQWDGEIVMMGDFNEVRFKSDRFGSMFNVRGAEVFNSFIANAGLVEVPLGGSAFTWCHKSASKMSKIDRIAYGDKSNALRNLMYKLKFLKLKIRGWINMNKNSTTAEISRLKVELADLDEIIDNGNGMDETVNNRADILNSIHKLHQIQSTEAAQKAKIKWSVEGDENVRFFHGMINKKRSQQNIQGVMVDGKWIEEPSRVKNQFFQHFKDSFDKPKHDRIDINMSYPRSLSSEQQKDLDLWDCGTDKSLGPDGFSFGFYRHFLPTIDKEVFEAVKYFFTHFDIPNGGNSVFIALILKIPDANMRQTLDGPFILNEVMQWCKSKKKQALFFKVDFEKAYDTVRWDFLDDVLNKFGFGTKWRRWIQCCLRSSRGSIIVNGSPTEEFQFFKCLKQASGLKINMSKSKILGIHVEDVKIKQVASKLGCLVVNTPFLYLGTKVGGSMLRVHAWDEVVEKVMSRLSRWKMKTLSIGGRLTLIKSVLGSMPIFHMSIFKVPTTVLHSLENIRSRFFKGHDLGSTKASWVKWSNKTSLWTRVIKAIHGVDGKLNVGNGDSINFWEDRWLEGAVFKDKFPRLYALETNVKVSVGAKLKEANLDSSFLRNPRGGIEQNFFVASLRKVIDENRYPGGLSRTRWVKYVPLKVNVTAWKIKLDALPTRLNISCRGKWSVRSLPGGMFAMRKLILMMNG
nr:RNA-directed DNA polymerase, eukaryota [Tanacetum cinerariifolium]